MPNDLTGDFDVVAEFAIPAVNRVLASMHRSERFLHSLTAHVDDNRLPGTKDIPTISGGLDRFGDAIVDHTVIGPTSILPGQLVTTHPATSLLDSIVNEDVVGANVEPVVPSHLQGRAQLQLSPPTIEVPDGSGTRLRVRMQIMSRYFPDPQTSPLPEFVRGELQITAAVNQDSTPAADVVSFDLKPNTVGINFISQNQALSAENLQAIHLVIRNALKTSFLPSSVQLPSGMSMQFKTLLGAPPALAMLLNLGSAPGNPGSAHNVFLRTEDDFALAAGRDFLLSLFPRVRDNRHSFWVYRILLDVGPVNLENGKIVIPITVAALTDLSYVPNLGPFTLKQELTLKLVSTWRDHRTVATGGPLNTAELEMGPLRGGLGGWLAPWVRGYVQDAINEKQDTVRRMFHVDENVGRFLKELMNPPRRRAVQPEGLRLAYTSVEIRPSGIVLYGSLAVPDWPPAHVEFQEVPVNGDGGGGPLGIGGFFPQGPDYSALKSWIPGGTIKSYEWSSQGQPQPFHTDENKFVLIHPPSEISSATISPEPLSGFTPICLTVRGERLSASGPVVAQPISATVCGYTSVMVIPAGVSFAASGVVPLVALTQPGPRGSLEVTGHTPARPGEAGSDSPNLIVHFADERSAGHLELLTQAVRESRREDAATAVLAVLAPNQLARAPYTKDVIYSEDPGGTWERVFGIKATRRPLTLIIGPNGKIAWQHEGELGSAALASVLREHLVSGGSARRRVLRSSLRIGQPPPNFLFEYASGQPLTLRKLVGRPVILVFWKSSSKPSLEAVHDLQHATANTLGTGPVVLAINDGEAAAMARRVAAESRLSAALVTDPDRRICLAYGVNVWPTIVSLDPTGLVRDVRYGRVGRENVGATFPGKADAAGQVRND